MDEVLSVLIAVGGFFIVVGFVADSIARAAVRRKIADKELTSEQIEAVLRRRADPDSVLKWGLLTTAVGIGFVFVQFLPSNMQDEPIVVGLVLIFAGMSLFLYRAKIRKQLDE